MLQPHMLCTTQYIRHNDFALGSQSGDYVLRALTYRSEPTPQNHPLFMFQPIRHINIAQSYFGKQMLKYITSQANDGEV